MQLEEALAQVVRSEHAHFSLIWEGAAAPSTFCFRLWPRGGAPAVHRLSTAARAAEHRRACSVRSERS